MARGKVLVTLLVLFTLLSGAAVYAQEVYKFKIPAYDEPFFGTWINTTYDGSSAKTLQKYVYLNWGYGEGFKKVGEEAPYSRFTFILVEKWIDAKGNTCIVRPELEQTVRLGCKM